METKNRIEWRDIKLVVLPFSYAPFNTSIRYKNKWIVRGESGGYVINDYEKHPTITNTLRKNERSYISIGQNDLVMFEEDNVTIHAVNSYLYFKERLANNA